MHEERLHKRSERDKRARKEERNARGNQQPVLSPTLLYSFSTHIHTNRGLHPRGPVFAESDRRLTDFFILFLHTYTHIHTEYKRLFYSVFVCQTSDRRFFLNPLFS
ncbi:hypothetical protein [Sulfolobus spindle-shaped virus]|nr:hypothetical protein [Sulfolobus spindle-shaped virus]